MELDETQGTAGGRGARAVPRRAGRGGRLPEGHRAPPRAAGHGARADREHGLVHGRVRPPGLLGKIGKISKFLQFLAGSFSAVSKRNFARKYAFDSIFQDLQDLHTFAPLQTRHFRNKSVLKLSNLQLENDSIL